MCYTYNISGVLDIVFNRSRDSIVIKDLKRAIIKTLIDSDTSQNIFNEELMLRIQNNISLRSNIKFQPEVVSEEMAM